MDIAAILVLGLVACVKSDVGYRYKVPATSYDVPFGSVGNLNNDRRYYHVEKQNFPTGSFIPPSSELQTPIHEQISFGGLDNLGSKQKLFADTTQSTGLFNNLPKSASEDQLSTFNLLANSRNEPSTGKSDIAIQSHSNFETNNQQEIEIQKHLYFYAAPDEPEEVHTRIVTPPTPTKKNVKILFIKAPTFNAAPVNIPTLPQNEEKTLVYVLVKKPEESSIVIPTPAPTKPTKPEVFFIKYKTQKEAQEAISNIQQSGQDGISSDYNVGSIDQDINLIPKISSVSHESRFSEAPTLISNPQPIAYAPSLQTNDHFEGLTNVDTHLNGPIEIGHSDSHFNSAHSRLSNIADDQSELSNIGTSIASGISGIYSPEVSATGQENSQQLFPSNSVKIDGHSVDSIRKQQSVSSTTNVPIASSHISEEIKIHQLYGPPNN